MSANVLPMPAKRSLFAHPAGVPLVADPVLVDAAAYALASLAGEDWNAMTPVKLADYRAWATLAATCASPEGLRLVAYSVGKTCQQSFTDAAPVVRRGLVDELMGAIRGAASRVSGVSNPDAHAALVALIEQDYASIPTGGW